MKENTAFSVTESVTCLSWLHRWKNWLSRIQRNGWRHSRRCSTPGWLERLLTSPIWTLLRRNSWSSMLEENSRFEAFGSMAHFYEGSNHIKPNVSYLINKFVQKTRCTQSNTCFLSSDWLFFASKRHFSTIIKLSTFMLWYTSFRLWYTCYEIFTDF